MTYTEQTWANGSVGGTPITAARLAHLERGILEAHCIVFCGDTPGVARPDIDKPVLWLSSVDQINSDDTRDVTIYLAADDGLGGVSDGDGTFVPHTHEVGIDDVADLQAALDEKPSRVYTKRTITGAYEVVAADAVDTVLHTTTGSALTVTLPADAAATVPLETVIPWRAYGAGQITFVAGSGATLRSRGAAYKSAGQYAEGVATKVAADTWLISGDLTT